MELGKHTTTTRRYKDWGREVRYDKDDVAAIQEAQRLESYKATQEALVVLGARACAANRLLYDANSDDFINGLDSALRRDASSDMGPYILDEAYDAHVIYEGVHHMHSILEVVGRYPAMRGVILEALSSPDNEREEAQ